MSAAQPTPSAAPRQPLAAAALPVLAICLFVLTSARSSGRPARPSATTSTPTRCAARRILDGQRLYDPAVDVAGGFAIYLYPPPFALAIIPLALLGGQAAIAIWTGLLIVAVLAGDRAAAGRPERALARPAPGGPRLAGRLLDQARPGRADPVPPVRDRLALAGPARVRLGDRRSGSGRSSRSSRRCCSAGPP